MGTHVQSRIDRAVCCSCQALGVQVFFVLERGVGILVGVVVVLLDQLAHQADYQ